LVQAILAQANFGQPAIWFEFVIVTRYF